MVIAISHPRLCYPSPSPLLCVNDSQTTRKETAQSHGAQQQARSSQLRRQMIARWVRIQESVDVGRATTTTEASAMALIVG